VNDREDDDSPSRPQDDDRLMSQDYEFEDALEKEWREVYGARPGRDTTEPQREQAAGPVDPAAA